MYSTMTPSSVASLSFFCLLLLPLPARHALASSHASSYKLGFRQFIFKTPAGRSSGNSKQVPGTTTCSSMPNGAGLNNYNKLLPVVHRQRQGSPLLHELLSSLTASRRDTSSQSSEVADPAPAASPAATTIPTNGSSESTRPGALDYNVLVSYGTPEQQFPVLLDTGNFGLSVLRCKPCASGSGDCDPAFDTSRSSTFANILCGSPECPTKNCSGGSVCPFVMPNSSIIVGKYAEDVLTLAPSMAIHDFRFVCLDVHEPSHDQPEVGILDLSRDRNSLPSRLAGAGAFSYCLPHSTSSQGFLSLGRNATVGNDEFNLTAHAPLVNSSNPELLNMYFIDLVGISVGGEDLPIPAGTFGGNTSANLDVGTTFTMLAPAAYALLRDTFRKEMSQYNHLSSPGIDGFDTCYNFTGLHELSVPIIQFKFSNGESLNPDIDQMLYYHDSGASPFTVACLAFSSLDDGGDVFSAVFGTYTLKNMEVVYDVAGGKVSFIPGCC